MNHFKIRALLFIGIIFLAAPPATSQQNINVHEIVEKVDELFRSKSSRGKVEMHIVTPHWERTLKMNIWTQGMEKTFIRITSPPKEKGVATLRIGDEMWNYLPKTNKVIKVPPPMMMSSWMGSDFNNDDLVDEFSLLEDYSYQIVEPDDAKKELIYVKCVPKEGLPIVWGKVVFAGREDDYIPVIEKYYDEKGQLMRIMNFKDIKTFGTRTIPSVMELIPQNEEGNKTVLRYMELEFNFNIDEDIFSLRNLRAGM